MTIATEFFCASSANLDVLPPDGCSDIFGRMLYAEAREIGISVTDVIMNTIESVPDGGIDARVILRNTNVDAGHLIVGCNPSYQIKSGEFKPWQKSVIYKELFNDKTPTRENLRSEIRRCFENKDTYILVCMKTQITPKSQEDARLYIIEAAKTCGFSDLDVRVWGQEQILECLNRFPALALEMNDGGHHGQIFSHIRWSSVIEGMKNQLKIGPEQETIIRDIQNSLRQDSKFTHINICGETGVGKTRLVLEATRALDLAPLVVYCDSQQPLDDFLNNVALRDIAVILVIDDCFDDHAWDKVRKTNSKIKLITISNEKYRIKQGKQYDIPPLNEAKTVEILSEYNISDVTTRQLARLCGGIPRFAHIVGFDAQNNPDEIFDDAQRILQRYIRHGDTEEQARQTELILCTFALFKRFGGGGVSYYKEERDAIFNLIKKLEENISLSMFADIIAKLKSRKILQGTETLYITPKMLHIFLWVEWWKKYSDTLTIDEIVNDLPESLVELFYETFEYVKASSVAGATLKKLFDKSGPLSDYNTLKTDTGSRLFHALSRADPNAALNYLECAMSQWTPDDLYEFIGMQRRNLIYGLERIMFESDLFERGGQLLRNFAEAENEKCANNATGTFCNMFSLVHMSDTRASPETRLSLLKDTICGQNTTRRSLGLLACKSAVTIRHLSMSSLANDDLELKPAGWEPDNTEQLQKAYQNVITMMCKKFSELSKDARFTLATIIMNAARPLLHELPSMAEYMVFVLRDIRDIVGDKALLNRIMEIIEFDAEYIKGAQIAELEKIRDEMIGNDYSSRMMRYVMMDMLVDAIKKNNERSRKEEIRQLAKESLQNSKIFYEHLASLVTISAKMGGVFGYELAVQDVELTLLPAILDAQRNSASGNAVDDKTNALFLSGYLAGLYSRDKDKWDNIMYDIASDAILSRFFLEIACESGTTDGIGLLILNMIKDDLILIQDFAKCVSRFRIKPSASVVRQWILALLCDGSFQSLAGSLSLFCQMSVGHDDNCGDAVSVGNNNNNNALSVRNDADLVLSLLTHDCFFSDSTDNTLETYPLVSYDWEEIATNLIRQNIGQSYLLCDKILKHMNPKTNSSWFMMRRVLDKIAFKSPDRIWNMATQYILNPLDSRGYAISVWMMGFTSTPLDIVFLERVERKCILEWISNDPHFRAPFVAYCTPPLFKKDSLAIDLLKRYGNDEKVSSYLQSAFFKEGTVSGSMVEHYKKKKQEAVEYKNHERDVNVHRWIDTYVKKLDEMMHKITITEKRMSY